MANTPFLDHDGYIAAFPADVQAKLEQVRAAIRKGVPDATEVISYNIPAFKLGKGWIFYYSAHAAHWSLSCPPPQTHVAKFKAELKGCEVTKSAIRFPLADPVPTALLTKMAKFRATQNLAYRTAPAKASKPAAKPKAKRAAKPAAKAKR